VDLSEDFIQGQRHLDLIAIASGSEELRCGAAKFPVCDPYRSLRQLRQHFFHRNGNSGIAHVGLDNSAFEFQRKSVQDRLQ